MSNSTAMIDPQLQNITLLMRDGVTPVTLTVADVDVWQQYIVKVCFLMGSQLGACFIMFFVVALLTQPAKRRKPVYWLNMLSLLLGVLRALFLAYFFWTPWDEFYAYFSADYTAVPRSAYATSAVGSIMPLLMTITVNLSLVIQAHTVCKVMERKKYILVVFISVLVLLVAIGFRFMETVTNIQAIFAAVSYIPKQWIARAALISNTVSIWWFSSIFISKLVWTLYIRKRMGFRSWNPMQVLMVMSGCTMIIPSIFAILEYVDVVGFPEAGSLCLTLVALMLPLSSLWASMVVTEASSSFRVSTMLRGNSSENVLAPGAPKTFGSQSSTTSGTRKASTAQYTNTTTDTVIEHRSPGPQRDSTELDLEAMGVRIDRSYDVQSEK